jgi:hypothetical protein
MYIYLNSNASSELFRDNRADSFIQKLPRRLTRADFTRFSTKECWEVALVDLRTPKFHGDNSCESVSIYCDICQVSMYENDMRPVLSVVHRPHTQFNKAKPIIHTVDTPRYITVTDHTIEYIKIYLLDEEGRPVPFENGSLRCTLHLRPSCA